MAKRPERYLSIDVETDGPVPGINSMLSLGAVIVEADGSLGETWTANLVRLPEGLWDPDTAAWWKTQPEAWSLVCQDVRSPAEAIPEFVAWCKSFGKLIPVAWPIAFDMPFVTYYCQRFAHERPLGFAGVDLRSLAWGHLKARGYYDLPEKAMKNMMIGIDNTGLRPHVALDDAIEQGRGFAAMALGKR